MTTTGTHTLQTIATETTPAGKVRAIFTCSCGSTDRTFPKATEAAAVEQARETYTRWGCTNN
jgi:hypothetical protein